MNIVCLISFGLIIHVIFLLSIFDIYFKSPIVSGILPEGNNVAPLGKRVVLVSVDGLRLDSLFDIDPATGKHVAEHMQSIIKHRGSWGVSESHVPTESRPGHVAILAGFYEDPSAVTKGWKENPVDFDSIFNRSYCSFAWGSPDILNIFFKGSKHNCAYVESYQNEQNFAGDTKEYDNWVYEKLHNFMMSSTHPSKAALHEEGIFFFLHLLGQDTSGHTHKPHSEKYRENLKNVDGLLKKIENLFNDFYGDDKTTFIFTSDHGMTNWGSHGAGDLDEINTPIVAWGAGIKKPSVPPKGINISQADITPLLAVLLGSSIPVNSIGKLPISFLNLSKKQIAEATELNARQMVAQYIKALENTKEQCLSWFYKPLENFSVADIKLKFGSIRKAIDYEKYSEAIKESKFLVEASLEGLDYYQNYYRRPLLLSISLSYLGWITYLVLVLFDRECSSEIYNFYTLKIVFCSLAFVTLWLISIQRLPFSFYCYLLLPQFLWYLVIKKACTLLPEMKIINKRKCFSFFFWIVLGVEILVVSFFRRWVICMLIGIILSWSTFSTGIKSMKVVKSLWLMSGVALAFFTLLPTVGGQPNPGMMISSGVGLCLLSLLVVLKGSRGSPFFFLIRFLALATSALNNYCVHYYFNENQQLLNFNQCISWFLLALSFCFLLAPDTDIFQRLAHVFITLTVPFLLLSVSHEGFFLTFLFIHLFCWIFIEVAIKNEGSTFPDFRLAYFFLAYIFISFFGLGNISSLNSFDPAWVRCFVTVFSPFLMCCLILFKTVIPFLVVTCTMRTITVVLNVRAERLFAIVLLYCNIMGLNFLFLIKNKGSWLDIGISISHYVIQQVTIVFIVLLFAFAKFLMRFKCDKNWNKNFNNLHGLVEAAERIHSLPTFYGSSKMHNF